MNDKVIELFPERPPDEGPPVLDEKDPLNDTTEAQLTQLIKQIREIVSMLEAQWESSKREFGITDSHMKLLHQYNEENRIPPPEGTTDDDISSGKYDPFNGLDTIPEEKVLEIFGDGHPIIGVQHTVTIDRVKSIVQDFFHWMSSLKEYRQVNDAYMELMETKEDEKIRILQEAVDKEEDPVKKASGEKGLEMYYYQKHLEFLSDPMDSKTSNRIIQAFSDQSKIEYWINKSREKLTQLNISTKFILEISQFEKRFLPERYHHQSNILLLYFMNLLMYSTTYDRKDFDTIKAVAMVLGLDRFVRNTLKPEIREKMLNHILTLEDRFLGKLPTAE